MIINQKNYIQQKVVDHLLDALYEAALAGSISDALRLSYHLLHMSKKLDREILIPEPEKAERRPTPPGPSQLR